jgi:adenine/guanine phosphoribosyltransferase-like PRPP-binding protein
VHRAFAVLPGFDFRGKRCLIVDDVITSGNTFGSLARLIQDYGGTPMGIFAARTEIFLGSDQHAKEL